MRVALFGGTGFVGGYLTEALLEQGHEPALLVRPGSESRVRDSQRCTLISGDIANATAVHSVLEGCEAAIYNIGILRERPSAGVTFEALQYQGARRTIDAAAARGVKRFLLMSANGVRPDGTDYQRTKYAAEEHLQASALEFTIFRPSVIFGDPRGHMEFATQLRDQMIRSLLPAPLFHDGWLPFEAGRFLLSPVHVRDVANAFVRSLAVADTFRQSFALCGPQTLEWRSIIQIIARACGTTKLALPVPAFSVRVLAALLDSFEFFPITRDQLEMLLEGNAGDSSALFALLGIEPTPFNEETLAYLRS